MKRVTCQSGLQGYECRLRESYKSFSEFEAYAEVYGLHTRLGYKTIAEAWDANPIIQGSTEPSDYRKVAD